MENEHKSNKKTVFSALIWKLMERFGVQGTQFVLQLVLARLLDPEHYGVLSLMIIFTTLANVFIQRGFNTALVQNKDVTEEDYSSVFWVTMGIAAVAYGILFVSAPLISRLYKMPDLVVPFRVLCLVLFPGALNSIQLAKVSRKLDFKKVFRSNIAAILISGTVGIVMAYLDAGLWALVAQYLLNVAIACAVMWGTVRWRPHFVCNFTRIRVLFSYGWKLLVSGLLDTLYQDIRSLVIGVKYDSGTLGYYNRGKQFPQFIINSVNNAVQTVLLPAMSAEQDDRDRVKKMMRNSITLSSYIIFPMMAGLAAVAEPLVRLLLTEKWLPCVPYMQIYCFTLAFYPVHSCNLQAINAMGRSDIFLKLEVFKKIQGLALLAIAVFFFDSPLAIAMTGIYSTCINCVANALPNKKLIGYSYFEQVKDFIPALLASLVMCGGVLAVELLDMPDLIMLFVQIVLGIVLYIAISAAAGLAPFKMLLNLIRKIRSKKT